MAVYTAGTSGSSISKTSKAEHTHRLVVVVVGAVGRRKFPGLLLQDNDTVGGYYLRSYPGLARNEGGYYLKR